MAEDDPRRPPVLGRLGMTLIWSLAFDEGLTAANRAGEAIALAQGPAAAAEYFAGAALAMGVTGNNPRAWELARQGLRHTGDRRDLAWARLVVLDCQRREWGDPAHPGIPLDTPERWEAARIIQKANPDPVAIGLLEAPFASRAEALSRSQNITVLVCYAGEFAGTLPLAIAAAEDSLARGQVIRAARCFMVVAFCQISLGRLDDGRAALEEAEGLAARGGAPIFGIMHAREMLTAFVDDEEALDRVAAEFTRLLPSLVPGQAWAIGPTYAILARTAARLGRSDDAFGHLEQLLPWLERAPAWSHHYPQIVGQAAETLWLLDRVDHLEVVEGAVREKVLAPDFRDMEVDSRLSLARLCALSGRHREAMSWFSEARRVLADQDARPLLAITDLDEGLMYVRRNGPGDPELARPLLEGALRQFEAIGMTGWVRRAEELSRNLR
jgi:tetratricopeptide (TPR) repeat protein